MNNLALTLTLTEPWASLLMFAREAGSLDVGKYIETRSWKTSHRGWLWIHAGKGPGGLNKFTLDAYCRHRAFQLCLREAYPTHPKGVILWNDLPKGVILGRARLVEIQVFTNEHAYNLQGKPISEQEILFGDHGVGRFGWMFDRAELLDEPIPAAGNRMLWPWNDIPENIESRLKLAWAIDYTPKAKPPEKQFSLLK